MTAAVRALYVEQGATCSFGFTYCQEGPVVAGVVTPGDPIDITGCIAQMQFRKKRGQPIMLAATSLLTGDGAGRIVLGGAAGTIAVTLTDEDTNAVSASVALYDLELTWPIQPDELRPRVDRLLQGSVVISPNVTQDDLP